MIRKSCLASYALHPISKHFIIKGGGVKIQSLPKFLFQISECMRLGAILISARGIGLRGAVQKKCHNLWEMSGGIIVKTPTQPQLNLT